MFMQAIKGLTGRKALIGLITIAIGICMEVFSSKGLTPEVLSLLQFVAIGFFLGNGVEHIGEAVKKKKPVNSDVMKLEDTLRKIQQGQLILNDQMAINQQQISVLMNTPRSHTQSTSKKPPVSFEEDHERY